MTLETICNACKIPVTSGKTRPYIQLLFDQKLENERHYEKSIKTKATKTNRTMDQSKFSFKNLMIARAIMQSSFRVLKNSN